MKFILRNEQFPYSDIKIDGYYVKDNILLYIIFYKKNDKLVKTARSH